MDNELRNTSERLVCGVHRRKCSVAFPAVFVSRLRSLLAVEHALSGASHELSMATDDE